METKTQSIVKLNELKSVCVLLKGAIIHKHNVHADKPIILNTTAWQLPVLYLTIFKQPNILPLW